MKNLHWAITASDEKHKLATGGYTLHQVVDIQVKHATTEKEAIKQAKKIIKRKWLFLRSVVECDCTKEEATRNKSLEISKETIKAYKEMTNKLATMISKQK